MSKILKVIKVILEIIGRGVVCLAVSVAGVTLYVLTLQQLGYMKDSNIAFVYYIVSFCMAVTLLYTIVRLMMWKDLFNNYRRMG
jgi:uncharacterized membrane protein